MTEENNMVTGVEDGESENYLDYDCWTCCTDSTFDSLNSLETWYYSCAESRYCLEIEPCPPLQVPIDDLGVQIYNTEGIQGVTEGIQRATEGIQCATEGIQCATEGMQSATEGMQSATERIQCATEETQGVTEGHSDLKTDCFVTGDPSSIPVPQRNYPFTVIFDLDETLISATYTSEIYHVTLRPNAIQLLKTLKDAGIEVLLWSAGSQSHIEKCLKDLDPESKLFTAAIHRHESWYTKEGPIFKKLSCIPHRAQENLLLVENNHVTAFQQKDRVLIIPSFHHSNYSSDTILYQLEKWFQTLLSRQGPRFLLPSTLLKMGDKKNHVLDSELNDVLEVWETGFLFRGLVCAVCFQYFECSKCFDLNDTNLLINSSKYVIHTYNYFKGIV